MRKFNSHILLGSQIMWDCTHQALLSLPICIVLILFGTAAQAKEQMLDPDFKAAVEKPAYAQRGPTVAIDEAHRNFHTAAGQYRPFADLLTSDGYTVRASTNRFQLSALEGIDVLVIANALPGNSPGLVEAAFTEEECDVVRDWVRAGGSLLLIADHAPFGKAAEGLAKRFGVMMGKGWAFDRADAGGITTQLVFSRENGLLGTHPILRGRSPSEEIRVIKVFTGQSLGVPDGASVLLSFRATAREAATTQALNAEDAALRNAKVESDSLGAHSTSVAGRAQGIAMPFGEGRIVVLGEAGFLSAQLIRWPDGREMKFGMNVPDNDNKQFALNVIHWLSRLE